MRKATGLTIFLLTVGSIFVYRAFGQSYDNTALTKLAQEYNQEYFDGKLPKNMNVHWADIPREKTEEKISIVSGRTYYDENPIEIQIDKKSNPTGSEAAMTLLHEECHVYTRINDTFDENKPHGRAFQTCMMNLALQGAFQGLW